MATAGKELQKLTECSICLKVFNDPRSLPCIHTFCLECLQQTCKAENKKPGEKMPCFLCRKEFTIPANDLRRLPKNFFVENLMDVTAMLQLSSLPLIACDICAVSYVGKRKVTKQATMRCFECRSNLCVLCTKDHKIQSKNHHFGKIGNETEETIRKMLPTRRCSVHNEKPLDFYCVDCKKILCVSCFVENHASHKCKDVNTLEKEFRQKIEKEEVKISNCAEEILSKRRMVEQRKREVLLNLADAEGEIINRNLELKEMIDRHTNTLLVELSLIKQKQMKDFANDKDDFERIHTILRSFETYCTELRSKGSASDVCSCVDELLTRAAELEKNHEEFIGRPFEVTKISFKATDLTQLLRTQTLNIVGHIQEDTSGFENCLIIAGLCDGDNATENVFKVNLHRTNDISTQQQIPTKMQNGASAAVYRNIMYVTGIGYDWDEIWKFKSDSGWMKCASLVQGRYSHCAALINKVLYVCGGYGFPDGRVLDSVEAYSEVDNSCTTVGKLVLCVQNSGNCVPFKSLLYIFGGADRHYKALNEVQVYDTKLNICTLLWKPMPGSFGLMQAVLWETSVILLGCDTCLIFNVETETWQERKQFKTDVIYFVLALENERIFVVGGGDGAADETGKLTWACRDDVRYVRLQSVIDDKPVEWKSCAKLAKETMVLTYGKIMCSHQTADNY